MHEGILNAAISFPALRNSLKKHKISPSLRYYHDHYGHKGSIYRPKEGSIKASTSPDSKTKFNKEFA